MLLLFLLKIDWLHLLARFVLRLHRYYEDTFPLVIFVPLVACFIGGMAAGLNGPWNEHLTFWEWFGRASILATKITFVFKSLSYLIWETYQGWKELKHWATHYAKKEN